MKLEKQHTRNILLVDDEPAVLRSLNRTLRAKEFKIFTALNGKAGLHILENEKIDLIISDMKMPGMSGSEFLSRVAIKNPNTVRMVLTGHADIDSAVKSINEGKVFSYLHKPWIKQNLLDNINRALDIKRSAHVKKHLQYQTNRQNTSLKRVNAKLGCQVAKRTQQLKKSNGQLKVALTSLKSNYETTIEVFCRMIELRDPEHAGHCKRVASIAQNTAKEMGLPEQDAKDIYYAGLLHDIGKIYFSEALLSTPTNRLKGDERKQYSQHAELGAELLMPLDSFHPISLYVRHHHERYNGSGFPDQLQDDAIPLGAAILAVAEDFDEARSGILFDDTLSLSEAQAMIKDNSGKHYHPRVVSTFLGILEKQPLFDIKNRTQKVTTAHLKAEMVLEKDLVTRTGALLLTARTRLTHSNIKQLKLIERSHKEVFVLWVSDE